MPDRPAWLAAWSNVILDRRGAGVVAAALELARRQQARDGGTSLSADAAWIFEVCRIAASGLPPATEPGDSPDKVLWHISRHGGGTWEAMSRPGWTKP